MNSEDLETHYSVEEFLKIYTEEIKDFEKYSHKNVYPSKNNHCFEKSLFLLCEIYKDKLEYSFPKNDPFWFHKSFRYVDVTDNGKMDIVFYHLFQSSEICNDVICKLYGIYKDEEGE